MLEDRTELVVGSSEEEDREPTAVVDPLDCAVLVLMPLLPEVVERETEVVAMLL